MIQIAISFLIGFNFGLNKGKDSTKDGSKNATKDVKKDKDKKTKKPKTPNKEAVPIAAIDPNFIVISSKKEVCHIEYNLIPNILPLFELDVVCWGDVAKIYSTDDTKTIKCFLVNGISWAAFTVQHKIKMPSVDAMVELHSHSVVINFSHDKLLWETQKDVPLAFYEFDRDFSNTAIIFKEVTETIPNIVPKRPCPLIPNRFLKAPATNKVISYILGIPYENHQAAFRNEITLKKPTTESTKTIESKVSIAENKGSKVSKGDRDGKSKSKTKLELLSSASGKPKKGPKGGKSRGQITIPGEQLFLDTYLLMFEERYMTSHMSYCGIALTVTDLLNEHQRKVLNPIQVCVSHVKRLPLATKTVHRAKEVYVTYKLTGVIAKTQTTSVPLLDVHKVKVDHYRVFLTKDIPPLTFLEAFQTGQLILKVYGIAEKPPPTEPRPILFGLLPDDRTIADRLHKVDVNRSSGTLKVPTGEDDQHGHHRTLLLGNARLVLFPLTNGQFMIKTSCGLTVRHFEQKSLPGSYLSQINTMDIHNDCSLQPKLMPILEEHELLTLNTVVKVTLRLGYRLGNTSVSTLLATVIYNRIIVVFNHAEDAAAALASILEHNASCLGVRTTLPQLRTSIPQCSSQRNQQGILRLQSVKRHRSTSEMTLSLDDDDETYGYRFTEHSAMERALTGFLIDDLETSTLVVEGLAHSSLSHVLSCVFNLATESGTVRYDSRLTFAEQLYREFLPYNGLYVVTLSESVRSLMSRPKVFLEGHLPTPSRKALFSIHQLKQCESMQTACHNGWFPTARELVSLDLEFGVPLRLAGVQLATQSVSEEVEAGGILTRLNSYSSQILPQQQSSQLLPHRLSSEEFSSYSVSQSSLINS